MASGIPGDVDDDGSAKPKKRRAGPEVEGVWVGCRGAANNEVRVGESDNADERDEMIWWSWDGKIVGFADW